VTSFNPDGAKISKNNLQKKIPETGMVYGIQQDPDEDASIMVPKKPLIPEIGKVYGIQQDPDEDASIMIPKKPSIPETRMVYGIVEPPEEEPVNEAPNLFGFENSLSYKVADLMDNGKLDNSVGQQDN